MEEYLKFQPMLIYVGKNLEFLQGGPLEERIQAVRRHLVREMGVVLPGVRVIINPTLDPDEYEIRLRELEVGWGRLHGKSWLVLGTKEKLKILPGLAVDEPVYGKPGKWMTAEQASRVTGKEFETQDPAGVLARHLHEAAIKNLSNLIDPDSVKVLLVGVAQSEPNLVKEVWPRLGESLRVLRNLLEEQIPIRDMDTILSALADAPDVDPDVISERIRRRLAKPVYSKQIITGSLKAVRLDATVEKLLEESTHRSPAGAVFVKLAPAQTAALVGQITALTRGNDSFVLLCSDENRLSLHRILGNKFPFAAVVGVSELKPAQEVQTLGTLSLGNP